ncbi:glycosyltransferase [Arthrobacter sp. H16F315]|uniref:glycosyltransferase n=1 Tax=Arthrobacter sp. H16F315 TaxID=2955314 RepID=UPI0020970FB2|nr:glycosyltransferase family 2 protein [Arthrobacter sp. H16F315]MDD1476348.1 glycosyltransferase family 2 protein [Arthrobacter sp. H16F315]
MNVTAALPAAQLPLVLLGLPVLVFGLVKLLVVPLAVWFELRSAHRRRREVPTLFDAWPRVSIIVPAFNEAAAIEDCVRSIQRTRYDRYELILVDDGSTDCTATIMSALAARDPRIKVLAQANAGKAAALNFGIRNAAGEVLMFIDADVILSRHTVEMMLRGFDDERTGAVCGDGRPVKVKGVQGRVLAFTGHIGGGLVRRALAVLGCIPTDVGAIGAFPRSVLEHVGLFRQDTVGEDLELAWRVHKAGYRVVFAPRAVVLAESPLTVGGLWRRRVRRYRGLLQTMALHKDLIGNLRYGPFGTQLVFHAITMVVLPAVQILLLLGVAVLLAAGYRPPAGVDWVVLAWLGLLVSLVLPVCALGANRAWKDLRHVWALPLMPLYSLFMSLAVIAALVQEIRERVLRRNNPVRTGSGTAGAQRPRAQLGA